MNQKPIISNVPNLMERLLKLQQLHLEAQLIKQEFICHYFYCRIEHDEFNSHMSETQKEIDGLKVSIQAILN
jgi:hypothetical protein